MGKLEMITNTSPPEGVNNVHPTPPPLPAKAPENGPKGIFMSKRSALTRYNSASSTARDLWDSLFDGGYRADVTIKTDYGGIIYAHANVLVSPSFYFHLHFFS